MKRCFIRHGSRRRFCETPLHLLLCLIGAVIVRAVAFEYSQYVAWGLCLLGAFRLLSAVFHYFLSQFAITNKRVIIRHGVLSRRSYDMLLKKIESISVDQSMSDRFLWGSGTLVITGTGGTRETFPNVGGAMRFERHDDALHAG